MNIHLTKAEEEENLAMVAAYAARIGIFKEVAQERRRQLAKFPQYEDVPDGTGGGGRETWRRIAQESCERQMRQGTLTFSHIFDEEQAEVLAETDRARLRTELVQCAAVCVKWIEKIDRDKESS